MSCLLPWLLFLIIAFAALRPLQTRVGDGMEYYATLVALAETGSPLLTQDSVAIFNQKRARVWWGNSFPITFPIEQSIGVVPASRPGAYVTLHFWFYPAFGVPFYWITQWLGISFVASFVYLHLALLAALMGISWRMQGLTGMWAVLILLSASPLWWFLNKGHTEFFTFFAVTGTSALLLRRRLLEAALLAALAGTQNPPFTVAAGVLCLGWLVSRGLTRPRAKEVFLLVLIGGLAVLSPVFYLLVCGVWNPIVAGGASNLALATMHRMFSLLIDLNLGLYPNWPLGIVILAAGLGAWRLRQPHTEGTGEEGQENLRYWLLFAITLLAVGLPSQASSPNLNSGGTVNIARYATWYVGLHYPLLVWLVKRWKDWTAGKRWLPAGLAAVALGGFTALNLHDFGMGRGESYTHLSRNAAFLFRHAPGLYSPDREIFLERNLHSEFGVDPRKAAQDPLVFSRHLWAVTDASCRKVLVLASGYESESADKILRPPACEFPITGLELYRRLKTRYRTLDRDIYVELSEQQVQSLIAPGAR